VDTQLSELDNDAVGLIYGVPYGFVLFRFSLSRSCFSTQDLQGLKGTFAFNFKLLSFSCFLLPAFDSVELAPQYSHMLHIDPTLIQKLY
jgi:hypothetical protein